MVLLYNIFFGPDELAVTMSVTVSLFIVVIFATFVGTVVPLSLERIGINPAVATGTFIQILNDIVGIIIYVYVAKYFLSILAN